MTHGRSTNSLLHFVSAFLMPQPSHQNGAGGIAKTFMPPRPYGSGLAHGVTIHSSLKQYWGTVTPTASPKVSVSSLFLGCGNQRTGKRMGLYPKLGYLGDCHFFCDYFTASESSQYLPRWISVGPALDTRKQQSQVSWSFLSFTWIPGKVQQRYLSLVTFFVHL